LGELDRLAGYGTGALRKRGGPQKGKRFVPKKKHKRKNVQTTRYI